VLHDWRLKTRVEFFEPYNYGVDIALEQGVVVFKIIWKFSTRKYAEYIDLKDLPENVLGAIYDERVDDRTLMKIIEEEYGIDMTFQENYEAVMKAVKQFREGATELEMDLVETEDNQPEVTACSLREDIVVPINTEDIQFAQFIDHSFYKSINEIKKDMRSEKYTTYNDDTVSAWASGLTYKYKRTKSVRASTVDEKMVLLHETCCWYDVNDDGIEERCIVTYPDSDPSCILRFIEVPYDHGFFPYAMVKRELNAKGAYASRGYPYLDEDYQVGISKSLNQAIDNGDVVNSPKVIYKKGCVSNIKNQRYTPAEPIEIVNGNTTDYEIRQVGNLSQGILFQQAQYLKSWADQRIGNVQSAFTDPTNMAGGGLQGQRTKFEAQQIVMNSNQSQSLDLLVWQMQMAEVHYQIDALYQQFGDDEEEVVITGEQPLKVNRREIQGRFHIIPNGRLENTDPMMRAVKTYNLMRVFAGDEDIKQTELKKLYLMDYDARIAKKIMLSPEEIQQRDKMKQQINANVKAEAQGDMIKMRQAGDSMDVMKELQLSKIPRREIVIDYKDEKDDKKKNALKGGTGGGNKKSLVHTSRTTYGGK
jgi:hypothetical protein